MICSMNDCNENKAEYVRHFLINEKILIKLLYDVYLISSYYTIYSFESGNKFSESA